MIKKEASIIFIVLIISNVLLWTGMLSTDGIIIQRDLNSPILNKIIKDTIFLFGTTLQVNRILKGYPDYCTHRLFSF